MSGGEWERKRGSGGPPLLFCCLLLAQFHAPTERSDQSILPLIVQLAPSVGPRPDPLSQQVTPHHFLTRMQHPDLVATPNAGPSDDLAMASCPSFGSTYFRSRPPHDRNPRRRWGFPLIPLVRRQDTEPGSGIGHRQGSARI